MPALLPLKEKALTRRDAADLLRGLAEMIDSYPIETVVVSLDIQAGQEPAAPTKTRTRSKTK